MIANFQFLNYKSLVCVISVVFAFFCARPAAAAAFEYDLGIRADDVVFSPPPAQLVVGQNARIYATVHNFGGKDMTGVVSFFQGPYLLGESQPISVKARGFADEVFIDFTVPRGSFNVLIKLQNIQSVDQNSANDEAVTPLITPLPDKDNDGVADERDNCAEFANADQLDTDGDMIGNACDPDDDNDGLADIDEASRGTSSVNPDTDQDGMADSRDPRPLSADVSPLAIVESEIKNQKSEITKEPTRPAISADSGVEEEILRDADNQGAGLSANIQDGASGLNSSRISEARIEGADQSEYAVVVPAAAKTRIPPASLLSLWLLAAVSAIFAGLFAFLALKIRTPKD